MNHRMILGLFALLLFSFTNPQPVGEPTSKVLFLVFEGSDWCSNCMRLEKNVLSDARFVEFLESHGIDLQKVDFPQRRKLSKEQRKENEALAEKYDFQGSFPTLILSRSDTLLYEQMTYQNQSTEEMMSEIESKLQSLR